MYCSEIAFVISILKAGVIVKTLLPVSNKREGEFVPFKIGLFTLILVKLSVAG